MTVMKMFEKLIPFCIFAVDQCIKVLIRQYEPGFVLWRIDGFLEIRHSVNPGAAFSILSGNTALLILLSTMLICIITTLFFMCFNPGKAARVSLLCLLGGAAGNLLDRILFSGVTDYIYVCFMNFPVFNFADIAITSSVFVLIALLFTDNFEMNAGDRNGTSF